MFPHIATMTASHNQSYPYGAVSRSHVPLVNLTWRHGTFEGR
jgi:hypothetical protein